MQLAQPLLPWKEKTIKKYHIKMNENAFYQAKSREKPPLFFSSRSSNSSLFGFSASEISAIYSKSSHFYLRLSAKKTGFQRKNGVLFSYLSSRFLGLESSLISLFNSVSCFDRIRQNLNRTAGCGVCRFAPFSLVETRVKSESKTRLLRLSPFLQLRTLRPFKIIS